jgi:hypothetical protein
MNVQGLRLTARGGDGRDPIVATGAGASILDGGAGDDRLSGGTGSGEIPQLGDFPRPGAIAAPSVVSSIPASLAAAEISGSASAVGRAEGRVE